MTSLIFGVPITIHEKGAKNIVYFLLFIISLDILDDPKLQATLHSAPLSHHGLTRLLWAPVAPRKG